MDADFSHDPAALPALLGADRGRTRPTSSSARATRPAAASSTGASAVGSSRAAGSLFARIVLRPAGQRPDRRLQGLAGSTLAAIPFDGVHAGGYVFQIEMTFRAEPAGARIREVPITFRDRRVGAEQDVAADRRRGARGRRPAPAEELWRCGGAATT